MLASVLPHGATLAYRINAEPIPVENRILVDGQQRVTALMASLPGSEVRTDDCETVSIRTAFDPQEQNCHVGIIEHGDDLDIETVIEIFMRVNSVGTALSQSEFAMSKIAVNETHGGNLLPKAIDYFCHLAVAPDLARSPGLNSACRNDIRSPPRQRLAQPAPPRHTCFM